MIIDQLRSKLVEYAKAKDELRLGVLRYFLSLVKNKEIELRPQNLQITDEVVFKVLKKQLKQLNETIDICQKAGRTEALDKANNEKMVLEEFAKLFPFDLNQ